ncbi:hypothetical protein [Aliarcobacter butzleri]|uniref:Lipoprotein n=1 Tax=Aliarcobacter butzleri L348 TaxID=1447256 RepID=A0A0G9JW09_9BACT|nr:hypothetical protein [Aliarcobacter butzleri]KLD98476.1 hypothetical protein AA20_08635 [Aliarcobacter butzleri L348]
MNKSLLSLAAIAALTLNISACATKQEIKEVKYKSVCPVLNVENTTQEQFDEAKGLIEGLQGTLPDIVTIYIDTLKHYNKVDNVDKYISKDGIREFGVTPIYGTLVALNYFATPTANTTEESVKMYQKAYNDVLNTIDASNPNWCELESYKHVTDKYTNTKAN